MFREREREMTCLSRDLNPHQQSCNRLGLLKVVLLAELQHSSRTLILVPGPVITELPLDQRRKIGHRKKDRGNFWYSRLNYSDAVQCYRLVHLGKESFIVVLACHWQVLDGFD